MHYPIGSDALRSSAAVINQSFLHSDRPVLWRHSPVFPGRLPIPRSGGSVRSKPIRVFSVPRPEEIPLRISTRQKWLLCNIYTMITTYYLNKRKKISKPIYWTKFVLVQIQIFFKKNKNKKVFQSVSSFNQTNIFSFKHYIYYFHYI